MASPNINGSGAPTQLALFSDTKTITGSPALTFANGVLKTPALSVEATYVTGQDVPPPSISIKSTWQAERGGDVYSANFEYHATGNQQAAVHGPYISSVSDAWDAYGLDAHVESGTDALQSYGAQFTVVARNPSSAQSGLRISLRGESDGSELREGLLINDVGGPNVASIRTGAGPIIFGDLKQSGGGLKPVFVDTATGKLVVGQ